MHERDFLPIAVDENRVCQRQQLSFGGEDDGPLHATLNAEGAIPDIFEKATTRVFEEAVAAAEKKSDMRAD